MPLPQFPVLFSEVPGPAWTHLSLSDTSWPPTLPPSSSLWWTLSSTFSLIPQKTAAPCLTWMPGHSPPPPPNPALNTRPHRKMKTSSS